MRNDQLIANAKAARKGRWTRRTALALGIGLAFAAVVGVVFAQAVLYVTPVTQHASAYSGSSTNDTNFQVPTLQVATVPGGVSSCTSSAVAVPGTSGSNYQSFAYLSAGSGTCATGHMAELFQFTYSATGLAGETATLYMTTTWNNGSQQTGSVQVTLTVTTTASSVYSSGNDWLSVYVDFGSAGFPSGGISTLSVLIAP